MSNGKALKQTRSFCLGCQGGSARAVQGCEDTGCCLYPVRLCTIEALPLDVKILRQIRKHCMICAGSKQDVRNCTGKETCELWSYRFGVLPSTFKRVMLRRKKQKETLLLPGLPGLHHRH